MNKKLIITVYIASILVAIAIGCYMSGFVNEVIFPIDWKLNWSNVNQTLRGIMQIIFVVASNGLAPTLVAGFFLFLKELSTKSIIILSVISTALIGNSAFNIFTIIKLCVLNLTENISSINVLGFGCFCMSVLTSLMWVEIELKRE